MSAKGLLVLCAQAVFVQFAFGRCAGLGNLGAGLASFGLSSPIAPGLGAFSCAGPILAAPTCVSPGLGYNGLGYGNAGLGYGSSLGYGSGLAIEVIPTSGGSLPVSSSSGLAPTGLSVDSENIFEGSLYVIGELPFLSAAALEGALASGGAGVVSYSCGNGITAIESIAPSAAAIAPAGAGYGLGLGAYGPGAAAPLSIAGGCNGGYAPPAIAPIAEIVATACGCGY